MASNHHVIQVAVPRPLHSVYDYHVDGSTDVPKVGARLRVPFGRSEVIGVCISTKVETPHDNTKAVLEILDADAAIAAVQADVNQNELDADNAITALQADVDQNESDAD